MKNIELLFGKNGEIKVMGDEIWKRRGGKRNIWRSWYNDWTVGVEDCGEKLGEGGEEGEKEKKKGEKKR